MSRKLLPPRRRSWIQKVILSGQTFYLGFGEYEDRTLGEVWIDASKAGSSIRATLHTAAIHVSTSLQYGMPLESIVSNLKMMDFEPNGIPEGVPEMEGIHCKSILDVLGRIIEMVYGPAPDHKVDAA